MTKKIIGEQSRDIQYELDGLTLQDAVEKMKELASRYGPTARLDIGTEDSYGETYARVYVVTKREETDEEYEGRLAQEARDKKMQELRERAEFERLAAKFKGGGK